jgi:hypothetical protein
MGYATNPQAIANDDATIVQEEATPPYIPEFEFGSLGATDLRNVIYEHGAIMLRKAANRELLKEINSALIKLFNKYAHVPAEEFEQLLKSSDSEERDFWQQISLGHIYDHTLKIYSGLSYFDIIKKNGLWNMATAAWPEYDICESPIANCRRIYPINNNERLWDIPIDFHVDAQVHNDEILSMNFWTPLVSCGITSPGLKVVLLGIEETKRYIEYNPAGYTPEAGDIASMYKFRCKKMKYQALKEHGLDKYIWAPTFNLGDILVFSNFTLHASHVTPKMSDSRMSVEIRIELCNR